MIAKSPKFHDCFEKDIVPVKVRRCADYSVKLGLAVREDFIVHCSLIGGQDNGHDFRGDRG